MFISGTKEIDRVSKQNSFGKHVLKLKFFIYGS